MRLVWALVAVMISTGVAARDPAQVRAFKLANPCPAGEDRGSTFRCRGWVVDHMLPLCAGAPDTPENMQWQEYQTSLRKDRLERAICRRLEMCK